MSGEKETLEKILRDSLTDIEKLVKNSDGCIDSKIIFPKYSDGEIRYSEQELKQIFLSKIEKSSFLYSVETPSINKYRFKDKKNPCMSLKSKRGFQSSMIDTSIYYSDKKLFSHIEFKHGQCGLFPIKKDFLKIICEDNTECNYFVHYFETYDENTKECVLEKYKEALKNIKPGNIKVNNDNLMKKCFVYLLFIGDKSELFVKSFYDIVNQELDQ